MYVCIQEVKIGKLLEFDWGQPNLHSELEPLKKNLSHNGPLFF